MHLFILLSLRDAITPSTEIWHVSMQQLRVFGTIVPIASISNRLIDCSESIRNQVISDETDYYINSEWSQ